MGPTASLGEMKVGDSLSERLRSLPVTLAIEPATSLEDKLDKAEHEDQNPGIDVVGD